MGHFTALATSTSAEAKEIHTLISIHPAFPYIRTSLLYDGVYTRFRETTDNLSEARIRASIHILHLMDEIGKSLGLIDSSTHNSVPEHLFYDAFNNPKYKAYSPLVTHESRLRQQQRLRKAEKDTASNDMNTLMHAFVRPKKE